MIILQPLCSLPFHIGRYFKDFSLKISIIWVKHFLRYLVHCIRNWILLWPEFWRGSLHIYLLSFPRFWTLSIERFWFLFWSILNGVTLKTSNSPSHLSLVIERIMAFVQQIIDKKNTFSFIWSSLFSFLTRDKGTLRMG